MFEWSAAVASLPNYRHCFFFLPFLCRGVRGECEKGEKEKKAKSKWLPHLARIRQGRGLYRTVSSWPGSAFCHLREKQIKNGSFLRKQASELLLPYSVPSRY